MTRKLFHENVYLKEFTANILKIREKEGKYYLVLDQTAFYPEGGGQPHDLGWIGNCEVAYVFEENGQIYHVTHLPPEKPDHVKCRIDWNRRFDHMQQHLGQHLLSAAFEKLFDAKTVGFHLGTEYVTIDVTLEEMSPMQAEKVEYLANQFVMNNLQVKQLYPDAETLEKLPLRKPPKVKENIRIIEVDQVDYSPCGGTHPSQTGEVGLIKIRKWEKIRGITRVEFLCGNRALKDYHWKNHQINAISNLLSVKDMDVQSAVERICSENHSLKKDIRNLKEQFIDYEAAMLHGDAETLGPVKIIRKIFDQKDFAELRLLATKLVSQPNVVALLGTKDENKAQIIFSRSKDLEIPMHHLFKEISPMINGKGGGNPQIAQGGGNNLENLEKALETAYSMIAEQIS
ncbi:alanyl-tRNA editing protein [Thermotalea metallivorans]|uniref:Alanine--tRNA ligase n=1 Tax=Thermotalea metallivorans TaxID=520762 RepID=A0A140LB63_9FIRM|nr:DHHA1 domain-containing protein [Thermotalea metallivorans]KXG77788.1 Alanine--tRNA ligase [Thermotalea metallivorans]